MKNGLSLILFLALMLGGGTALGFVSMPDAWYAALEKPAFNPPNWIFAPVWTTLYILIAIAGWRIWVRARGSLAMKAWWTQLVLNFAWSPAFFVLHQIGLALAIILVLLATIITFIVSAWKHDRLAAPLFIPYAAWVSFASLLNASLFALN